METHYTARSMKTRTVGRRNGAFPGQLRQLPPPRAVAVALQGGGAGTSHISTRKSKRDGQTRAQRTRRVMAKASGYEPPRHQKRRLSLGHPTESVAYFLERRRLATSGTLEGAARAERSGGNVSHGSAKGQRRGNGRLRCALSVRESSSSQEGAGCGRGPAVR